MYESFCPAFMCLQFEFVVFWQKDFGAKAAHKILVNLLPGPPETPETQVSHLPQDVPAKQLPPQAHPDRARRPEDQPRRQDRLRPGANVIKLFLSVIHVFLYKARVFIRIGWKRYQGKHSNRCSTLG